MVFSSVPLYLDPPNWQQHPNQHQLQGSATGNHDQNQHLFPPPPPMQPPPQQVGMGGGGGGGSGTASQSRPNSMAERARMAKIPPPEAPLKCPRCDSTNTKFCYFNNYSLTQPRHFCKTCRRYWTRGGALRSVPVGGGCRRNKRSSGSKSSSGGASGGAGAGGGGLSSKSSLSSPTTTAVGGGQMEIGSSTGLDLGPTIPGSGGMTSFMASLVQNNIAQIGMGNLGLTFGGSLHPPPLGGGIDHHHNHHHHHHNLNQQMADFNPQIQFPNLLGGFEVVPSGGSTLYTSSFQNDHDQDHHHNDNQVMNVNVPKSCSTMMSPVKMEESGQGLNLAKQLMGISSNSDNNNININANGNNNNNNQFWVGTTNMWTDLSGLNSSSSSHLL